MSKGLKNTLRLVSASCWFSLLCCTRALPRFLLQRTISGKTSAACIRSDAILSDFMYLGSSACYMSWMPYDAWAQSGLTSYTFAMSSLPSYGAHAQEARRMQQPQFFS